MEISRRGLLASLASLPFVPGQVSRWLQKPNEVRLLFEANPGLGRISVETRQDEVLGVYWCKTKRVGRWERTTKHPLVPDCWPDNGGWQTWSYSDGRWCAQLRCRTVLDQGQACLDIDWVSICEFGTAPG